MYDNGKSWAEQEQERELKNSVWKLDGDAEYLRRLHMDNCDVKAVADEHRYLEHDNGDFVVKRNRTKNQSQLIIIIIMLIIFIFMFIF